MSDPSITMRMRKSVAKSAEVLVKKRKEFSSVEKELNRLNRNYKSEFFVKKVLGISSYKSKIKKTEVEFNQLKSEIKKLEQDHSKGNDSLKARTLLKEDF